jgi:hypothetical protein
MPPRAFHAQSSFCAAAVTIRASRLECAEIGSQAMTTEKALIVGEITHFPSFCAFAFKEDNPSVVTWIDFWAVEPCSSAEADYARGRRYADEAIWHVRATGQPVFIECVLIFMGIKLRERERCVGGLEQGFIDRIANDFPNAMDNVLMRLLQRNLKKKNPVRWAIQ